MQRDQLSPPLTVRFRILLRQSRVDDFHLRASLVETHARLQLTYHLEKIVSPSHYTRIHRQRNPKVRAARKPEIRRRNSHNRMILPIKRDRPSHHIRIGAESPPPEVMAQNGHPRGAGTVLLRQEDASKSGTNRQQGKEVGSDGQAVQPFGFSHAGEVESPIGSSGHALEAPALLSPVYEVRQRRIFGTALLGSVPDVDQAVRTFTRQWTKQDSVDDAEDSRIRADAERKCYDCHDREAGTRQ